MSLFQLPICFSPFLFLVSFGAIMDLFEVFFLDILCVELLNKARFDCSIFMLASFFRSNRAQVCGLLAVYWSDLYCNAVCMSNCACFL